MIIPLDLSKDTVKYDKFNFEITLKIINAIYNHGFRIMPVR